MYIDDFARTDIGRAFDETWCYVKGYPGVKCPLAVNEAFQRMLDDPAAEEALQHPALAPLLEKAAD